MFLMPIFSAHSIVASVMNGSAMALISASFTYLMADSP